MGYSDGRYQQGPALTFHDAGTNVYTSIASAGVATGTQLGNATQRAFMAMNVKSGAVTVRTAAWTTLQPCTVAIMNGTSTVATAVVTTLTAGQTVALTVTAANAALASGDVLSINEYGTATASTASGGTGGKYDVELKCNEAFT